MQHVAKILNVSVTLMLVNYVAVASLRRSAPHLAGSSIGHGLETMCSTTNLDGLSAGLYLYGTFRSKTGTSLTHGVIGSSIRQTALPSTSFALLPYDTGIVLV